MEGQIFQPPIMKFMSRSRRALCTSAGPSFSRLHPDLNSYPGYSLANDLMHGERQDQRVARFPWRNSEGIA